MNGDATGKVDRSKLSFEVVGEELPVIVLGIDIARNRAIGGHEPDAIARFGDDRPGAGVAGEPAQRIEIAASEQNGMRRFSAPRRHDDRRWISIEGIELVIDDLRRNAGLITEQKEHAIGMRIDGVYPGDQRRTLASGEIRILDNAQTGTIDRGPDSISICAQHKNDLVEPGCAGMVDGMLQQRFALECEQLLGPPQTPRCARRQDDPGDTWPIWCAAVAEPRRGFVR